MKAHKDFTIVIEQAKEGTYIASVSELKGCRAEAKTMEELQELIKIAIKQHLGDKDAQIRLEEKKGY